jgi:hypothetical protein
MSLTTSPSTTFTGSISGTTLTVTAVVLGSITPGQPIADVGGYVTTGTTVVSQVSGISGGVGVYTVNTAQSVSSETMYLVGSGPQYPPLVLGAGSNSTSSFNLGLDPIGDIIPFNVWSTIISQYANSPIIDTLIQNFQAYLDQTKNLSNFYDMIWNIATAQGHGLDVWGRIVGVNRILNIATGAWFGFGEALPSSLPFNQGVFYNGSSLTTSYSLTDQTFRELIMAKAMFNISNGSIGAINYILRSLFPNRGNCYVTDGIQSAGYFGFAEATNCLPFNQGVFYNGEAIPFMSIQYVFWFQLSPVELSIVQTSGVLPKPVGVASSVVIY